MQAWMLRALMASLAPLLLAQGLYARAKTPKLPEAQGDRQGRVGRGPGLRLLIAGDSAAAGVGVHHHRDGLAGQLTQALAGHFDVSWQLLARSGFTTGDLLAHLRQQPVQRFDVAVLSLGVNDVTSAVRLRTWLAQQQELAGLLTQRFAVKRIFFSCLPPMQEMRALPQPLRRVLGARSQRFNVALAGALDHRPQCELLTLALPEPAEAFASDRLHPSALTYRHWAAQLAERIMACAPLHP